MSEPKIPGGYIILARQIDESEIMNKPPLYMKVWVHLLCRAQHTDYKQMKRGQLRTSIPEIQEACSWYVGARKVTPTQKEVRSVLDWMRGKSRKSSETSLNGTSNDRMIDTTKGTHGMLVTIENYEFYQDPTNYERHTEGRTERRSETSSNSAAGAQYKQECNKNDKNDEIDDWLGSESDSPEITEIQNLFIQKAGRFPSAKDLHLLSQAVNNFPMETIRQGIDAAFEYKESQGETINSFAYCYKAIESLHRKKTMRGRNHGRNAAYRNVHGRNQTPDPVDKAATNPIWNLVQEA